MGGRVNTKDEGLRSKIRTWRGNEYKSRSSSFDGVVVGGKGGRKKGAALDLNLNLV